MKKFKLTNIQTEAILNMKLGSLKKLDELSTKKAIKDLNNELNILNKLIKNKSILERHIIEELQFTNKQIDKRIILRRSKINTDNIFETDINFDEFQEIEKLTVLLSHDGFLKCFKGHLEDDKIKKSMKNVKTYAKLFSNQKILLFVSSGKVYTLNPNILPSGNSNPKNFIFYVESSSDDKLVSMTSYEENKKCILASKFGKGFIADLSDIQTSQKKGKKLFNLKPGDELIKILSNIDTHIACVASNSKLLIFETKELPILKKGSGVQFQKFKSGDTLSDIQTFDTSEGIIWKIGSQSKIEKKISFWLGKRAQTGKKVPKRFSKNLKFNY